MIEEHLRKLGFNDTQIQMYLAVLRAGKTTPARVAKETGINRTTVYSTAKQLKEVGVIDEDLGGKSKYLVARPPEDLERIIDRQRQQLQQKEEVVEKAVEELHDISASVEYSVPRLKFVEEHDLEDFLYQQTEEWNESLEKTQTSGWGFQDHTFFENYRSWFEWYWEHAPDDIKVYSYTNESESEATRMDEREGRREMKFWPHETDFTGTVWMMGEYVLMVVTRDHPHYAVQIRDSVLAHNLREYFKQTWDAVEKDTD